LEEGLAAGGCLARLAADGWHAAAAAARFFPCLSLSLVLQELAGASGAWAAHAGCWAAGLGGWAAAGACASGEMLRCLAAVMAAAAATAAAAAKPAVFEEAAACGGRAAAGGGELE
jgi:hypothetical protein